MTTTILPLMIDVHSHAHRGPEWAHKGTLETETKSALVSGFGTVLTMPNSNPPIMTYDELIDVRGKARDQIYCDVGFHFGSLGDNTQQFSHVWSYVHGLKLYLGQTTGGYQITINDAEGVFTNWTADLPILVHAEGALLVKQILKLAGEYNQRVHICHVSLAEQVTAVRKAKHSGQLVTAEVCPHHLIFTQDDIEKRSLGGYGIMKPPLATSKDQESLWEALQDGAIDMIATDHAPHAQYEKEGDDPAFGVISEPTFSVLWTHFSERNLPIDLLTELTTNRPARIFGVLLDTGSTMEVDLDSSFVLKPKMIQSTARSPYTGKQLRGRIQKIYLHGTLVYENGEIIGREGRVI